MFAITKPAVPHGDLEIGYQLTCPNCDNTLFIPVTNEHELYHNFREYVNGCGWRMVITDDTVHNCVCPRCVAELQEIEQGQDA